MGGKVFVNIGDEMHEVDEIEFVDEKTGKELRREEVTLDTTTRIAGVFVHEQQVLLLHRKFKDREYYGFPGGHQRENEDSLETLQREMVEETGLEIDMNKVELLLETRQPGFGPEKFYLVKDKHNKYNFQDEDPNDKTNKLVFLDLEEAAKMQNVFPREVLNTYLEFSVRVLA